MRKKLTVTELHDLLAREFDKSAAGLCSACSVPRPVFLQSKSGPNWRVPALEECPALCHTILQDVAEKLARDYDLAPPRKAA